MTFAQSRLAVLKLLRKFPFLRGYKLQDMASGYIYCPYIPLITTPITPEQTDAIRRHLAEDLRRAEDHLAASQNVDLTVR